MKWTPFMIPEHKKLLAKLYESENDVLMPELDDQLFEGFQETIEIALENNNEICIEYYAAKRIQSIYGRLEKIEPITRTISFVPSCGEPSKKISLQEITNIYQL